MTRDSRIGSVRRIGSVVFVALAMACGGTANVTSPPHWLSDSEVGTEPVGFTVLAGNWTVGEENGQRLLHLDGSSWMPGTPPTDLTQKATALFGAGVNGATDRAAHFEARVREGLQFPFGVNRGVGAFSDGELQVGFRLIGGESDQYAALLFGLGEDANHYAFRYNTKDGDAALWKVVDGQRERVHEGGVPVAIPLGEWHTLRLRVDGPRLTGWVDDIEALTYTLPEPVTGRVGLWSKADSVTDYRDFSVVQR